MFVRANYITLHPGGVSIIIGRRFVEIDWRRRYAARLKPAAGKGNPLKRVRWAFSTSLGWFPGAAVGFNQER